MESDHSPVDQIGESPAPRERRVLRPVRQGSMRAVLVNGPFLRLWLAQAISQTANNMVNFALLLRVRAIVEMHGIEQANTAISLTILAFSLPSVIFGPLAGVAADRMNRRTLMAIVNGLRGVAIVFYLVIPPDWPVERNLLAHYLVTFLVGAVGQFFAPAQGAMIPLLVERQQLMAANALFNLTFTGSQLIGFATLGPVLAKLLGVDALITWTIVLFLGCAGLVMTLPSAPTPRFVRAEDAHPMRNLLADVREGLVFILRDRALMKAIASMTLSATTFMMIASLGPEFITEVVGLPTEDIGYIVGPAGIGVVLGVILVPRLVKRFERDAVIDWAIVLAGVMLFLLALSRDLLELIWRHGVSEVVVVAFAGTLTALLGICDASILVPSQTILQERSHEHIRARVYATFFTVSNTVAFIPIFFAAAAADIFGVVRVLVVVALLLSGIGLVSVLQRRASLRARWERVRTRHRQGPEAFGPDE